MVPARNKFVWAAFIFLVSLPLKVQAGRFMAVPFAETLPRGRATLWQFGLYEKRGSKTWRSLNRLDLGLRDDVELGVFIISPRNQPPSTWINAQFRIMAERREIPSLSAGVWDAFSKGDWFSDKKSGPSPFISAGKTLKKGNRFIKAGASYGFNRLDGGFGGMDVRFEKDSGFMAEYSPANLRLSKASAWDFSIYRWFSKSWRARFSWMGGNPMLDVILSMAL